VDLDIRPTMGAVASFVVARLAMATMRQKPGPADATFKNHISKRRFRDRSLLGAR